MSREAETMFFAYIYYDKKYMEKALNEGITSKWFNHYGSVYSYIYKYYNTQGIIFDTATANTVIDKTEILLLYTELMVVVQNKEYDYTDGGFNICLYTLHKQYKKNTLIDIAQIIADKVQEEDTNYDQLIADITIALKRVDNKTARFFGSDYIDKIGLTNYIVDKYKIISVDDKLVYYNDQYKLFSDKNLQEILCSETGNRYTKSLPDSIKPHIQIQAPVKQQIDNKYVVFKDCVVDVTTRGCFNPTEKNIVLNYIPHRLGYNQQNKQIQQDVMDIFNAWTNNNQDKVKLLFEIIGQCMSRQTPEGAMQRIFVLLGKGENGKSKFLNLLKAVLGKANYSMLSLNRLCDENVFNKNDLEGKIANIIDDASNKKIFDISQLKTLITGGSITAAYKYQDERVITLDALTVVIGTNGIPKIGTSEDYKGASRRLWFVEFDQDFEVVQKPVNIDLLVHPEKYEEALEYVCYKAMNAYMNALKRGSFTKLPEQDKILAQYKEENQPINTWIDALKEEDIVSKTHTDIQQSYKEDTGIESLTRNDINQLKKRINEKYPYLEYKQPQMGQSKCYLVNEVEKQKYEAAKSWGMEEYYTTNKNSK